MRSDSELGVVPVDQMVGGDGDTPGLTQPITIDDIQDALFSEQPLERRRMRLLEMRDDLRARQAGDTGGEFDALVSEVERALATLDQPGDVVGTRDALGLASDERLRADGDGQPDMEAPSDGSADDRTA